MKIAIISDTHDNFENTRKALDKIYELECKTVIHCGDICSGLMIQEILKYDLELLFCFGNMDDKKRILQDANKEQIKEEAKEKGKQKVTFFESIGKFDFSGKNIGFTHFPEIAEKLAGSGEFDVVFHGHTHRKRNERINGCLIVNPGEIVGFKGDPSFAVYDSEMDEIKFFQL